MSRKRPKRPARLRIVPAQWQRVAAELRLSAQQARLVRLMLDGRRDKQIALDMSLKVSTVRTYLTRLFERTGSGDRVDLLLRVFAVLLADCRRHRRQQE